MRFQHLFQAAALVLGIANAAPSASEAEVQPRQFGGGGGGGGGRPGGGRPGGGRGGGVGGGRGPGGDWPNGPGAGAANLSPGFCHTPSSRGCWNRAFNIDTDYEANVPNTGKVRKYNFTITEVHNYIGGDEKEKSIAMLINDQFPGPVVWANWGDWIEVTVRNELDCEGTSIHWHGIRMLANAVNDGANGVTECPIAPGTERVYRFRAEQYGTSWYHSHYSSQYANGVTGSIHIEGPASQDYEVDLGVFPITDWYYGDAETLQRSLIPGGAAPASNNILFNGTHVNADGGGEHYRVKLQAGKTHRLRIINPSVDNHFSVSLVNHEMTVIAADFVPVNATIVDSVFLIPGQRYDVIIDANQPAGNYWFNVTFSSPLCGSSAITASHPPAAIFQYDNVPEGIPTIEGTAPFNPNCQDDTTTYTPIIKRTVPSEDFIANEDNTIDVAIANRPWENVPSRLYWDVHGSDMNVTWDDPTLEYVARNDTSFPQRFNLHEVTSPANAWAFWIIENISGVPHPMHLHGHDMYVLGTSGPPPAGTTTPRAFIPAEHTSLLQWDNPTRRDTTMLPARGWLVLAFRVDNPGAWLFHCHIAWHAGQGLSMQFLERVAEIPDTVDLDVLEPNCQTWTDYYATATCKQFDSGLRRM